MSSILIRDLDEALYLRLQALARVHRRSPEEEARETLRIALAGNASTGMAESQAETSETLMDIADRIFGTKHGLDEDIPYERSAPSHPSPDFSDPSYDR